METNIMLQIRPFEESDSIQDLTTLLHRAYAHLGNMGLNYTAVDQSPEMTAQRIQGGNCFVAEKDSRLVGTILVTPTYAQSICEFYTHHGVASVHQFAVDPQHQGVGIGRMLLQKAELWAKQAGFSELGIDTAEQATHLLELYNHLGYHPVAFVQWPGKVYHSIVLRKYLVD
jgi:GNAT superfamily N-acetyltransferase